MMLPLSDVARYKRVQPSRGRRVDVAPVITSIPGGITAPAASAPPAWRAASSSAARGPEPPLDLALIVADRPVGGGRDVHDEQGRRRARGAVARASRHESTA